MDEDPGVNYPIAMVMVLWVVADLKAHLHPLYPAIRLVMDKV